MKHTVKSIAEKLNVDKVNAHYLVKFLQTNGLVKPVGSVKFTEGKGKGYTEYEFLEDYTEKLSTLLEGLR